jgi:IMP dehydrogenase
MTREGLVTTPVGTSLADAERILHRTASRSCRWSTSGRLRGLITFKDINKRRQFPNACKDEHGRLSVGAAIGASERDLDRAAALVDAGVDVLVIDTAHGHAEGVLQAVARVRERFPDVQIIAGNVATREGAAALSSAGSTR